MSLKPSLLRLLDLLSVPRRVDEVASVLGYSEESVRMMLGLLKRRGYAQEVGCNVGCGTCSLKNLCPSVGVGGELWLITLKGRELLKSLRERV